MAEIEKNKINKEQMLRALLESKNKNVSRLCLAIITRAYTEEEVLKTCGIFMKLVLTEKFHEAFCVADYFNKLAILKYCKEFNLLIPEEEISY